jgi:selenocysteine-specific elongation factor
MKHVIVGTAGHIDHGKSALVRALTGTDPDRLKEEKERGITIDLGFAFLTDPDRLSLGFVDVPGHERFVKNMLAGVGGIDLVMLVVAADESVMPQTREHFDICRLLHVQRGLVVITKADLVERELREVAAIEVGELTKGSFLEGAPVVHVSSKTGEGVEELKRVLLEIAAAVEGRSSSGLFRLPVDRVFSMKGFGAVVTGTLICGSIGVDEEVEVLPRGSSARVRGLQVHGEAAQRAVAGQRTAVNLQGVEVSDIRRGDSLARPGTLLASMMLDADLEVLSSSPTPIKDLARVHLHVGTAVAVARVRVLGNEGAIPPGGRGLVQFRLETPVVAAASDRFIIRRYSPLETLGGGRILDSAPPKRSVSSRAVVERLAALRSGDRAEAAALFVAEEGARGLDGSELARRLGVDGAALERIGESLLQQERAFQISEEPLLLLAPATAREISERILRELQSFQKANPLREGMPRGELREKATARAPVEIFEWLLARLVEEGKLRTVKDWVATSDHRIELSSEEADARAFLSETFLEARYQPSALADIASKSRRDLTLLQRIQRLLIQEGTLVKVAEGMVFHREVLEGLKKEIGRHKRKDDRIDVAYFKELAGVTRKYAIPLLEWLDRERVTRRVGKERVIL